MPRKSQSQSPAIGQGKQKGLLPRLAALILRRKITLIIVIAALARLAVLLALPGIFAFSEPGGEIHGSEAYDEYALNLLTTGVYGREPGLPDAAMPPLYSLVLAGVYGIFGREYMAVALLHIVFDMLSIALLAGICRQLVPRQGEWVGALAALFFALYSYLIFQNLTLNDTALWILLLHLFVWLLILLRERERLDRGVLAIALAAGLVLGASVLARALLPTLAILVVPWFLLKLNWRDTLWRLLPVALMSLLVTLPWLLRGAGIYGGFVPIALNSGENIYQGNNIYAAAVLRAGYDVQWLPAPVDAPPRDRLLQRNAYLAEAGWRYLREHPAQIPELLLLKLSLHWNPQVTPLNNLRQGERLTIDESGQVVVQGDGSHVGVTAANAAYQDDSLFAVAGRSIHALYFGALWLLALGGLWTSRRDWRSLSLLWAVQLSQTAMYLLFHPSTRYRSPTDPLLFVFSALAAMRIRAWWRRRRDSASVIQSAHETKKEAPK